MGSADDGELDVVIIGAGISGIDVAHHVKHDCPGASFVVLERRAAHGGTWDLMKYPGIRSDSDMFTFGYNFRPWPKAITIAEGHEILEYLGDTIDESGLAGHMRYEHQVTRASWSSHTARWTLECANGHNFVCRFLFGCSGYYDHDRRHKVAFPKQESFQGKIVHPQHWELESDEFQTDGVRGKRVVVIGSGATAITLIPSIAMDKPGGGAAHVTMLQRSPTYIMQRTNVNPYMAQMLEENVDPMVAHERIRMRQMTEGRKMQEKMAAAMTGLTEEQRQARMKQLYHLANEPINSHLFPKLD